jgi:hypothetical protein
LGLAYSRSAGNFFADDVNPMALEVSLYSITADGNSSSLVGEIVGPDSPGYFSTGNLAFGPGGSLHFNFSSDLANPGTNSTLYTLNTSTGALTAVGSGLGSNLLALFSDGTSLYGVDAISTSDIGVFRIDTTSGIATQVSTVTGLPDGNFYVDTATVSTPDAGSTLALLIFALAALLGGTRLRGCLSSTPRP